MKHLVALTLLASLLLPMSVSAYSLAGGSNGNLVNTGPGFGTFQMFNPLSSDATSEGVMPIAGYVSRLYFRLSVAAGAGAAYIARVRIAQVDTALTCTIGGASDLTCSSLAPKPLHVNAGDLLTWSTNIVGAPALVVGNIGVTFTPDTPGDMAFYARGLNASTTANSYAQMQSVAAFNGNENAMQIPMPDAGVIDQFQVIGNSSVGAGTSQDFWFRVNGATTTPHCQVTGTLVPGTNCSDLSGTATVAAGDLVNFVAAPTGTPTSRTYGLSVRFRSSTGLNVAYMGNSNQGLDAAAVPRQIPLNGNVVPRATAQSGGVMITQPQVLTNLAVYTTVAPGATGSRTFTVEVNGVLKGLTCTISGSSQSCLVTNGPKVLLQAGDYISLLDALTGTPAQGVVSASVAGYVLTPAAFVVSRSAIIRKSAIINY